MQVYELFKLMCVMKVIGKKLFLEWHYRPILTCERFEFEHSCWDPKDGDLCLNRVKPGETLVEARSGTDVQIVRLIWV